jgi:hypothetical protein
MTLTIAPVVIDQSSQDPQTHESLVAFDIVIVGGLHIADGR